MQVQVLYFGFLKELLKRESERLDVPGRTSVGQLLELLLAERPEVEVSLSSIAVAVNREYVGIEMVLSDGDEVALLPPVSGGARSAV